MVKVTVGGRDLNRQEIMRMKMGRTYKEADYERKRPRNPNEQQCLQKWEDERGATAKKIGTIT